MPLLLCDLDDTLVDRARVFAGWLDDFARMHRLPDADRDWVQALDGGGATPRADFFGPLADRIGTPRPVSDLMAQWVVDFPARYRPDLGVLDALRGARSAGWRLGIVTNGHSLVQGRKIAAAGLDAEVDAVCISEEVGFHKPDPQIFHRAAQRASSSLAGGWMVGDNPVADIAGGSAVGLRTVWLSRGRPWPLTDLAPEQVAASPAEAIRTVVASQGQ